MAWAGSDTVVPPRPAVEPPSRPIQIVVDQQQAAKPSSSLKLWHVILIGIAIFYVAKTIRLAHRRWTKYRRDRRCEGVHDRILVILYSFRDADEAARTILSLIRSASCPSLISFAVFQEFDPQDEADVHTACLSMCMDEDEREMVDRLRIISRSDATETSRGPLHGIREAFRNARKGEKFCCVVPCGARGVSGWDELWLGEYRKAVDTLPWNGAIALTCEPETMRSPSSSQGGDPYNPQQQIREDSIGGVAQNLLRSMTETTQQAIVAKPRSTYPVVSASMNGRFPVVETRVFPQENEESVQSIILGSCVMTTSKSMRAALKHGTMSCPPYALSYLLSALLHTHAGASFVAAEPVFLRSSSPRDMRPSDWDSRGLQQYMMENYGDYNEFCGVDMDASVVLGRATMGVLIQLESSDILSKYGTRRDFERGRSRFS